MVRTGARGAGQILPLVRLCALLVGGVLVLLATPAPGGVDTPEPAGRPSAEIEHRLALVVEALKWGDAEPALRELRAPEVRRALIGDYTDYLYAEALLRSGDVDGAGRVAESVAERFPARPIARPARLLAAYAAARGGDESRSEALLRRFLTDHAESPETPAALYMLGLSFEARGARQKAAQTYRELALLAPASEYADGADDRLRALARSGVVLQPFSPDERVTRAERLLRSGAVEAAREEAEGVVARVRDPDLALRALAVVASAHQRARRYDAAAAAIELALARAPVGRRPALALELGRTLYRAGRNERALAVLARLDGTREVEAEAGYLRVLMLEEDRRFADAAALCEQIAARDPGRDTAASALWRLGWLQYLAGERAQAAAAWTRLRELPTGQRYRVPATYWTARALEELGRPADARQLFEAVLAEATYGYYGMLAAARSGVAPTLVRRSSALSLPADPAGAVAGSSDMARIELLARLGLEEAALVEMDDLLLRSVADPLTLYGLSVAYGRQDRYDLALRIIRRHFSDAVTSGDPAIPRAFWEIAYPRAWSQELADAATRTGLDRFLLAAVVREESSFFPRALSRAGARGLMQVLPQTARRHGGGLAALNGDALDEPEVNVSIGAAILADHLREFSDPRLAIAAYNAGPARLRQWWEARRSDDVEAFVEQIPYEETRLYVKRVMVAWAQYRRLYGSGNGSGTGNGS